MKLDLPLPQSPSNAIDNGGVVFSAAIILAILQTSSATSRKSSLDFRMLYYFLLENRQGTDAHRFDFLDIKAWQRPKTDATKRMAKLADFISKHRAHLSMSRFVPEYQDLEEVLGVKRLTAEYLGRVLLDYLNVLDDFIDKLPDTGESGKRAWLGAAGSARYKTEVALGLRESDYPESFKPLKSVAAGGVDLDELHHDHHGQHEAPGLDFER